MTPERLPRAYNVNKTPLPSHKVPRVMRAKAKKAPMRSVSLLAIELKGLATPGEALKNLFRQIGCRRLAAACTYSAS